MSQIVCIFGQNRSDLDDASKRASGMTKLGERLTHYIKALPSNASTNEREDVFRLAVRDMVSAQYTSYTVWFTDSSGHTDKLSIKGSNLVYINSSGRERRVDLVYTQDNESNGAQKMYISGGDIKELNSELEYFEALGLEGRSIDWGQGNAEVSKNVRDYVTATVNFRRCR